MSRKGNCWDNSVSESFFDILKTELIHHCRFKTQEEAREALFEYIEVFYNRERIHSANDYLSPVDYVVSIKLCKLVSGKVLTHQFDRCHDRQKTDANYSCITGR